MGVGVGLGEVDDGNGDDDGSKVEDGNGDDDGKGDEDGNGVDDGNEEDVVAGHVPNAG